MTDWRNAMRQAAEQDEQDRLSVDEVKAMRRVVLAAVTDDTQSRRSSLWMRPVLVAATVVAMISAGVVTGLRLDLENRSHEAAATEVANQAAPIDDANAATGNQQSRQLQFMTAGGTRIIWVFNSELDLKATLR